MPAIITLTTDFGTDDPFVGIMKGVILSIHPKANIIDHRDVHSFFWKVGSRCF